MKFLHTGDLHIGKMVHEFPMLEDQRYILRQILEIAAENEVDAVVIAGDVYDRSIPSTEAVNILNDFLTELTEKKIPVLMISGNHDSAERVGFADRILEKQGLYIGGAVDTDADGQPLLKQVVLEDEEGPVRFVLLPFVKPAVVGAATAQQAVEKLLENVRPQKRERCVLITHYFVVGKGGAEPELSDSETRISVGGLEYVTADTFAGFAYVALGHIHKPQHLKETNCYYAGSPLPYSFSECEQIKGVNLVTLTGYEGTPDGGMKVERIPLRPLHRMRIIQGKLMELLEQEAYEGEDTKDYIQAVLTDERELVDPIGTLRKVYPNIMQIRMKKNEQKAETAYEAEKLQQGKDILGLFCDFYELVSGSRMEQTQVSVLEECLKQAQEEEKG